MRINFYLLRTFCPYHGRFFFSSLRFGKFHLWLLVNQLWSIDFFTPPTPLALPGRLPGFVEFLMPLKN